MKGRTVLILLAVAAVILIMVVTIVSLLSPGVEGKCPLIIAGKVPIVVDCG